MIGTMNKQQLQCLLQAIDFTVDGNETEIDQELLSVKTEIENVLKTAGTNERFELLTGGSLSHLMWLTLFHRADEDFTTDDILNELVVDGAFIPLEYIDDAVQLVQHRQDVRNMIETESQSTVEETEEYLLATKLKAEVNKALVKKQVEMYRYIDDMIDTADGQTPAECGLDPEHNINEFIKDLDEI